MRRGQRNDKAAQILAEGVYHSLCLVLGANKFIRDGSYTRYHHYIDFEVVQNKVTGEFLPVGDDMHPSNSRLTKGSQYRRFAVILPRPYDVLGLKRKWIESSFKVN